MIDIDAEFRKAIGITSTCNVDTVYEPLTIEMLRSVQRSLGPPLPQVRVSRQVPALGRVNASSEPKSDDMRQMVEDIGDILAPTAWQIKTDMGDVIFVNPVNIRKANP